MWGGLFEKDCKRHQSGFCLGSTITVLSPVRISPFHHAQRTIRLYKVWLPLHSGSKLAMLRTEIVSQQRTFSTLANVKTMSPPSRHRRTSHVCLALVSRTHGVARHRRSVPSFLDPKKETIRRIDPGTRPVFFGECP